MGSMKNTQVKGNKLAAQQGKMAADFESLVRAGRVEYKNSMVEAASAEVYALRHVCEELFNLVREQGKAIAEQQMQINALQSQVVKGRVTVERTVTETITVNVDEDMTKQYRKGINIMWNCGIPPVNIAFNEFDLYRRDNNIDTMITPDDVRSQWSTLAMQSKRLTGMPLSRLLNEYAKSRKLNY